MADESQLEILKQGVAVWNDWRKKADDVNLAGADLHEADLGGADLRRADLRRANLNGANLGATDLSTADRGGRLRRDSVSVPLSGSSAGWVNFVPLPGRSRREDFSPTGVRSRQRR